MKHRRPQRVRQPTTIHEMRKMFVEAVENRDAVVRGQDEWTMGSSLDLLQSDVSFLRVALVQLLEILDNPRPATGDTKVVPIKSEP